MNYKIIKDTTAEYLAQTKYEGSTYIKNAISSDQEYLWFKKAANKSSDSQEFGTFIHMAILEPELFHQTYFVFDDSAIVEKLIDGGAKNARATKEYKEWVADQMADNAGRIALPQSDFDAGCIVQDRLSRDSRYKEFIVPSTKETSIYVERFYESVSVKIRPDSFFSSLECDVKTTKAVDPKGFFYEVLKYKYHLQRALYRDVGNAAGLGLDKSVILAISNKAPFEHEFYFIPENLIEEGRGMYQAGLANIARIRTGEVYDGYAHNYITDEHGFIILGDK